MGDGLKRAFLPLGHGNPGPRAGDTSISVPGFRDLGVDWWIQSKGKAWE